MSNKQIIFLFILAVLVFGCGAKQVFNEEEERNAILALLQQERRAHFDRNTDLFVSEFTGNMLSVNKGKVTMAGPVENKRRISAYFASVEFIKWDDVAPPVIKFSKDGSLAYAVVEKQVILQRADSSGRPMIDSTHYAWVSIYEKQNGHWKVECNVSTNK